MSTGNIILENNRTRGFNGLVMCGGSSNRMGKDKSLLIYYEKTQREHVYEMLEPFCEIVYLSCKEIKVPTSLNVLTDDVAYSNSGPIAGILTAFDNFPDTDLLVAGCDYPYLKDKEIADMLAFADGHTTAFYNKTADLYEPLLAYYSHKDAYMIKDHFINGGRSLQSFLRKLHAGKFYPRDIISMKSIDTTDEYLLSKNMLNVK